MINYVEPVSNILSISVDRQRLFLHKIQNHQGNEFLRKLIRAEIIGTVGDYCRETKGAEIRFDQVIRTGFRGRIGTGRIIGCALGKIAFWSEAPIDLVCGYVQKTKVFRLTSTLPVFEAGFQEAESAYYVCFHEGFRSEY